MTDIRISKRKALMALAVVALTATLGCSFALFGSNPDEADTTGTPGADLTGTPGATSTPAVAVVGVIDEIEDDHVVVAGQVYVLPESALASLDVGDRLIILVRYDCDVNLVCQGGDHEGDEDDD